MVMDMIANRGSLTPAQYDAAEALGRLYATNRMIEAFCPVTFNASAYPTHIDDERELWRYVDVMHETRLKVTISQVLEGLTRDEFDLFERAVNFMIQFTVATFGRPLHCENALLRAMNIYRYIKAINPRAVLELGPGSGYLGLLLILDGIGLIGCDNTQAFYLMQNRIWGAAAGANFSDLAQTDDTIRDALSRNLAGKVVHVPWWKVVDLEPESLPGQIDVVTANHCLAEMQNNARKYYLSLSRNLLGKSGGPFLFEGWGAEHVQSRAGVARDFVLTGFRMCHEEQAKVTAYSPVIPGLGASAEQPRSIALHRKIRNFLRWIVVLPPIDYGYIVRPYKGDNKFSNLIVDVQRRHTLSPKVETKKIINFLKDVYGSSPDIEERFLELIGTNYCDSDVRL
jgi:hypothetical protein